MEGNQEFLSKNVILFLLLGLVVGSGGGYLGATVLYRPKINDYEKHITDLTSEVSNYNSSFIKLKEDILNYKSQISNLELELYDAEQKITNYKEQISNLESKNALLIKQIEELEMPDFEIIYVNVGDERTTFKIKNIGGKDAHDIRIKISVEFILGVIARMGQNTTIQLLKAGETREGFVTIGRSNAPGAYINSVEFIISCKENISKNIKICLCEF